MTTSRRLVVLSSTLLVLGLSAAPAPVLHPLLPKGRYGNDFASVYPNSRSADNVIMGTGRVCQLCHFSDGGGDGWNGYGWSLRLLINQGQSSTNAMSMIEGQNSDPSYPRATNLREIRADTQPGWTAGAANTIFFKDGTTLPNQMPPAGILGSLDPPCLSADGAVLIRSVGNSGSGGGHAPLFDGCGELDPENGQEEIILRNARSHAPALFLGAFPPVDPVESPWGTLVAEPAMVTPFVTDAMGEVRLGLPTNVGPATVIAQWAVLDPDASAGIALSNALRIEWR